MPMKNSLHSIQFILYTTLLLFKRGTGLFKFKSIFNLKYGRKIMFNFAQGAIFPIILSKLFFQFRAIDPTKRQA